MRERKDKSSGASSGRDRNAKSRAKRSPNPEPGAHQTTSPSRGAAKGKSSSDAASKRDANKRDPNDTVAPGAHHTSPRSGSANDRIARKARHADSGSSAESSTNPGAQHTSAFAGSAKTSRIARKARHADGGASAESANHNNRSTGLSSNPSRIEAKLREVGLGEENATTTNNVEVIPEKEEKVPSAYQVEAELIEDDYEGNQRQPYPGAVGDVQPSFEDNQADDESISTRKKRPWGIIVVVLLLVIGGGALAAWFFLFRDGGSKPLPLVETNAPTTPSPSSSPSGLPSSSPTFADKYDPPDPEDCIAIAQNRTTAREREDLDQFEFGLNIDVTLDSDSGMVPSQVWTLSQAIQEKLAPRLLGCPDVSRRKLEADGETAMIRRVVQNHRQLFVEEKVGNGPDRFVIADAFVNSRKIEVACTMPFLGFASCISRFSRFYPMPRITSPCSCVHILGMEIESWTTHREQLQSRLSYLRKLQKENYPAFC